MSTKDKLIRQLFVPKWVMTSLLLPALASGQTQNASEALQAAKAMAESGRYQEARPLALNALELLEAQAPPEPRLLAEYLNAAAEIEMPAGDLDGAEKHLGRAYTILRSLSPRSQTEYATVLRNLGSLSDLRGKWPQAREKYEEAAAIFEKLPDADRSEGLARTLNAWGGGFVRFGEPARAVPLLQRACAIREQVWGAEHRLLGTCLQNLAAAKTRLGATVEALPLMKRSLEIQQKAAPNPEHPRVLGATQALAGLYSQLGETERAKEMTAMALRIQLKAAKPDELELARTHRLLGLLEYALDDYAAAEQQWRLALEVRRRRLGERHKDTGDVWCWLGLALQEQSKFEESAEAYRIGLDVLEASLGGTNGELVGPLHNAGVLSEALGEYAKAEAYFERSLAILKQAGGQHIYYSNVVTALGLLKWAQGRGGAAVPELSDGEEVREKELAVLLTSGSEAQKRAFISKLENLSDIIRSYVFAFSGDDAAVELGIENVLRQKGRVTDTLIDDLAALRGRVGEQDGQLLKSLIEARGQRASLQLAYAGLSLSATQAAEIGRLEEYERDLEDAISRRNATFPTLMRTIGSQAVRERLPAGSILIEYFLYRPYTPKGSNLKARFGPARYGAFTLRAGQRAQWIDIGPAREIDALVADFRLGLSKPGATAAASGRRLHDRLLKPVAAGLAETRQVLISPDGQLNLIPFAALLDEKGNPLLAGRTINYLASARDVVRWRADGGSTAPPVVVANPDFGPAGAAKPLPGTADEAAGILALMAPGSVLLTGSAATKGAVQSLQSPGILHVATHGFFLDRAATAQAGTRALQLADPSPQDRNQSNPLLRSALVLAGANRPAPEGRQALLTALEASSLNLAGTQLVVLSACETGLGDVLNGEGVYGLRRAFTLAGARAQVMSLWKVSDVATRDLMVLFYQALRQGQSVPQALRSAQLQIRSQKGRQDPFYWAGFIPAGNPTALHQVLR